jgi:two-component system phosphate regulon response regulator PhoB
MHGDEAEARLKESVPDLLILDWMLPGLSGIELCRRLRQKTRTQKLPIIMLTARGEEPDKLRGFETGADDYVVKPFSVNELVARASRLLQRANPQLLAEVINVGDIELDRAAMVVRRRGQMVHLGPTDYRLLEFMMQAPGRVFSREQLLNNVWGDDVYIDDRTVDVHIGRLRKALLQAWKTDPIRTVRGAGYSLSAGSFAGQDVRSSNGPWVALASPVPGTCRLTRLAAGAGIDCEASYAAAYASTLHPGRSGRAGARSRRAGICGKRIVCGRSRTVSDAPRLPG